MIRIDQLVRGTFLIFILSCLTFNASAQSKYVDSLVEVLKHSRPRTPATREKKMRRSTRIASRSSKRAGVASGVKNEVPMSSDSSLSSDSSPESSVNEWTDVETRVSVSII